MSTKIQLDHSALKSIIGGDSAIELELRNAVVQEFAKKHLKAVANGDEMKKTLATLARIIEQEFVHRCEAEVATFRRSYGDNLENVKLNSEIEHKLDVKVRSVVEKIVEEAFAKALKTWANDDVIERMVTSRFEYWTKDRVDRLIRKRLEKALA